MENKTQSLETDTSESGYLRQAKDFYWFSRRTYLRSLQKMKSGYWLTRRFYLHSARGMKSECKESFRRAKGFYWLSRRAYLRSINEIKFAYRCSCRNFFYIRQETIRQTRFSYRATKSSLKSTKKTFIFTKRSLKKAVMGGLKKRISSPYWVLRKRLKRIPGFLKCKRQEVYWWGRKRMQILQQRRRRAFQQLQCRKHRASLRFSRPSPKSFQVSLWFSRAVPKQLHFLSPRKMWNQRRLAKIVKSLRFLNLSFGDRAAFEKRVQKYDSFAKQAVELARTLKPELVHAHDLNAAVAGQKIWKELGIPFIYESHELWTERNRPNISVTHAERVWEEKTEKTLMEEAAASITVCDSIAEHLAKAYNVAKPAVVRNTPPRIQPADRDLPGVREHFGISKEDFVAVYVGKLAANRGILDILRALTRLPENVKVITLGMFDPKFQIEFDYFVNKLKLQGRIFCHPTVPSEEVAQRIRDCDVSLTTMNRACLSYVYTLPNKLFESLQASLPIIGPDSPEIIRIVEMYRCGLTYRDGDHVDLAEKISELMSNSQMKNNFREGAFEASRELCWEIEQGRLLSVYDQLFSVNPSAKTNPSLPQPVVHSEI